MIDCTVSCPLSPVNCSLPTCLEPVEGRLLLCALCVLSWTIFRRIYPQRLPSRRHGAQKTQRNRRWGCTLRASRTSDLRPRASTFLSVMIIEYSLLVIGYCLLPSPLASLRPCLRLGKLCVRMPPSPPSAAEFHQSCEQNLRGLARVPASRPPRPANRHQIIAANGRRRIAANAAWPLPAG